MVVDKNINSSLPSLAQKTPSDTCRWLLGLLLLCAATVQGEDVLKSSLQPGETLPASFEPYNVTGDYAGKRHCLVCENGLNPVVMIFARQPSEALGRLLDKLDTASGKKTASFGAFVVFLGDRDELEKKLAQPANQRPLKHVILSIEDPPGPDGYKVAEDADVTVVLYTKATVKANHSFRKGRLNDQEIERILADLPRILPNK